MKVTIEQQDYTSYCRSNHQKRCSVKKGAVKISQISQENTCVRVSF